ncbi:MAG: Zn-dependent hydrolase, partial [Bryobacteraceae bacterium]
TPMEVMDAPFRAGDLRHGYQAVADNLPNDPRIHQAKGTKKIFFKNFMDARVDYVVLPLARQLMRGDQARKGSGEGYLAAVVLHEISHGLGPAWSRQSGKRVDIREAIGPVYAALEEAKADVTGMFGLRWLMDHGALPRDRRDEYYVSCVAGIFRTVRYGVAEAHGRAEMMEFNFLASQKAIGRVGGRYVVDYDRMPGAIAALAKQLLAFEAKGDRAGAEAWFNRYDQMPPALETTLKAVKNVPVDIDLVFDFPELPARENALAGYAKRAPRTLQ